MPDTGRLILYLDCACGHTAQLEMEAIPEDARPGGSRQMTALERARCDACGRVGRPKGVSWVWVNTRREEPR